MAFKPRDIITKNKESPKKETPSMIQERIKYVDKYNFDASKVYLVVNGKVKEVSPKSKYMLDMLIIEEE